MTVLPRALLWKRLDTSGSEHVVLGDQGGLTARGVAIAADPIPYTCRYELSTDDGWATTRFEATAEGAGWTRTVRMERRPGRWRVTTAEQGDLDAALHAAGHPSAPFPGVEDPDRLDDVHDIDLYASPLTNTLPIRRLGLLRAPAGTERTVVVAWILLPSLAVLPSEQTYEVLAPGRMRFGSPNFTADLDLDPDGYVIRYPALATR